MRGTLLHTLPTNIVLVPPSLPCICCSQLAIDAVIVGLSFGKGSRGGVYAEYILGLPNAPHKREEQPTSFKTFCRWVLWAVLVVAAPDIQRMVG